MGHILPGPTTHPTHTRTESTSQNQARDIRPNTTKLRNIAISHCHPSERTALPPGTGIRPAVGLRRRRPKGRLGSPRFRHQHARLCLVWPSRCLVVPLGKRWQKRLQGPYSQARPGQAMWSAWPRRDSKPGASYVINGPQEPGFGAFGEQQSSPAG